jgi:hypothetical protein
MYIRLQARATLSQKSAIFIIKDMRSSYFKQSCQLFFSCEIRSLRNKRNCSSIDKLKPQFHFLGKSRKHTLAHARTYTKTHIYAQSTQTHTHIHRQTHTHTHMCIHTDTLIGTLTYRYTYTHNQTQAHTVSECLHFKPSSINWQFSKAHANCIRLSIFRTFMII